MLPLCIYELTTILILLPLMRDVPLHANLMLIGKHK
jgi:hypothetical protein